MKIFNITFCILFVISAALQYNDPDPWLWIPLYLYGALLCWLASLPLIMLRTGLVSPLTLVATVILAGLVGPMKKLLGRS